MGKYFKFNIMSSLIIGFGLGIIVCITIIDRFYDYLESTVSGEFKSVISEFEFYYGYIWIILLSGLLFVSIGLIMSIVKSKESTKIK